MRLRVAVVAVALAGLAWGGGAFFQHAAVISMRTTEEVNFRPGKEALIVRRDDQQDDFELKVVCMQLRDSKVDRCAPVADIPRRRPQPVLKKSL